MIPITERMPVDKQNVLVDLGNRVEAAEYNDRLKIFERYNNCHPGDRCLTYFYSGVTAWMPFPEPSGKPGFVNELEKPMQVEPVIIGTVSTSGNGEIYTVDIKELSKNAEYYPPITDIP